MTERTDMQPTYFLTVFGDLRVGALVSTTLASTSLGTIWGYIEFATPLANFIVAVLGIVAALLTIWGLVYGILLKRKQIAAIEEEIRLKRAMNSDLDKFQMPRTPDASVEN